MKNVIILLSLVLLASCKGSGGSTAASSIASNTPNNFTTISRTDNVVQNVVYDITNGGSSYYSSTNNLADNDVFTIPSVVTLTSDSIGAIQSDDYVELQIVNRIRCNYAKSGNQFNFVSCTSFASSVYWTIQSGDVYTVTDLNADSPTLDKNKVIMVLKSNTSTVMNGHITFNYDL